MKKTFLIILIILFASIVFGSLTFVSSPKYHYLYANKTDAKLGIINTTKIGVNYNGQNIYGIVNVKDDHVYLWDYPQGDRNYNEYGNCRPHEERKGVCRRLTK